MKRKHKGHTGEVALKLDISKAYARVDWKFLRSRMVQMGFCDQWTRWIMMCINTVQYSTYFNGALLDPVIPKRGLR